MLYAEIQPAGGVGRQVVMAAKLAALLGAVDAMKDVNIERLSVVDSGGGHGVANAATQRVNASIVALELIAGAMRLDLDSFVRKIQRVGLPGTAAERSSQDGVKG